MIDLVLFEFSLIYGVFGRGEKEEREIQEKRDRKETNNFSCLVVVRKRKERVKTCGTH
jgi:hypothetical protein